jgi:hypothetical protein
MTVRRHYRFMLPFLVLGAISISLGSFLWVQGLKEPRLKDRAEQRRIERERNKTVVAARYLQASYRVGDSLEDLTKNRTEEVQWQTEAQLRRRLLYAAFGPFSAGVLLLIVGLLGLFGKVSLD